jgi:very-short-patch-repair endonuclease
MKPRVSLPQHLTTAPFTQRAGIESGLGAKRLRGRDLQRPFRGVRTAAGPELTVWERAEALRLNLPPVAFFCSVTAALLLGAPLPARLERDPRLHVAVPAPRRAPSGRGVVGHQVHLMGADVRCWRGLPVSAPERLWCELARDLSLEDLVAVGDYLISRSHPLTSRERLADAAARYPGRRGLRAVRRALELVDGRSESRKESVLRVILEEGGLHGFLPNPWTTTSGGYHYRLDLALPALKIAIEYQSDYHRAPEQFRADMTRISRLQADGWEVIQVNADDLRDRHELLRRIRRVIAQRENAR